QRAHARSLPDAQRADVGLDELHGVVDREAGRNRAARRVDVEEDVLVRVLGLEEQELRHDQVGGDLGHRPDQEHHALLQQPGIDVVGALAAPRLLDDHRDQPEVLRLRRRALPVHAPPPISSSKETRFAAPSNDAGLSGSCPGFTPRACRSAAERSTSCCVSISTSDFGSSIGAASSSACSAWPLMRASTRFLTSRSTLARISARILARSPSATPSCLANSASSAGSCGSSTLLTFISNEASFPATSLPW